MLFRRWSGVLAAPCSARHYSFRWNIMERSRGLLRKGWQGPLKGLGSNYWLTVSKVFWLECSMCCLSSPRKKSLRQGHVCKWFIVEGDSREQEWGTSETGWERRESQDSCIGHCSWQLGFNPNRNFWGAVQNMPQTDQQGRSVCKSSSINSHPALAEVALKGCNGFAPLGCTWVPSVLIQASHINTSEEPCGGHGEMGSACLG